MATAVALNKAFPQDDVRTAAAAWVESNLPPGSHIVVESYSPLWATSVHDLELVRYATDRSLEWYRQHAVCVLLYARGHYAAVAGDPHRQAERLSRYHAIFDGFTLVKEFRGPSLGYPFWVRVYAAAD